MEIEKEILEYELIDICIDSSNYKEGEEATPYSACDVDEESEPAPEINYDADGIPMGDTKKASQIGTLKSALRKSCFTLSESGTSRARTFAHFELYLTITLRLDPFGIWVQR